MFISGNDLTRIVAASSAPQADPRVYGDATTSKMSQLQDVINENNKLLLVAALQAGLGGLPQPRPQQQASVYDLKDIDAQARAEAFASMLRSHKSSDDSYGF